ncbi:uncharacterized protein LOC119970373 isoform X1 [Scyliorhinus canicula]|uniref:uncharacterized protein LOC119970373 isoform X1 n=2 Tax=Scyliorhinus canicula TaxID=7830 RepID=UPI0018F28961|nr:uncharacterized protein LOC119970373 isoform X1 [Scyliorhinus canicula]
MDKMSSAAKTSKHLNAETILKTDTPRTRELKTLRAKRLAYFVGPNYNCTNAPTTGSSLETNDKHGSCDHKMRHPLKENLVNSEQKDSLMEKTLDYNESGQHTRIQDVLKTYRTDMEPLLTISKSDKETAGLPKPDYNLLQNPTVSEIQKLRHILSWAQEILKNSEEDMKTGVCQKACTLNERELIVSHVNSDTEKPVTSNCSWDTDRIIYTGSSNDRWDDSHYSADTCRSSDSGNLVDLLRRSGTLDQMASSATSPSEKHEQYKLTDSDYLCKDYFSPNPVWKSSFPEQGNAYRDNVLNNNWKTKGGEKSKMHVAQLEFPADENYHSALGDMRGPNKDKFFWIPLDGSSDEEEFAGNGERREAFVEPTISARTVILRKSPEKHCYTSDQLASPVNFHNITQHCIPTLCDKEKYNYIWEPLKAKEYLAGGYHKTSAEDSEAVGKPDVFHNLDNAGFSSKSQMDLSFIPSCGAIVSPTKAISVNEIKEGIMLARSFRERPNSEPSPDGSRNVNLTNINETLLSHLSVSPQRCCGKILNKTGTEKLLALENDPLKKEANHNKENYTSQQIIDCQAHSTLKLSSSSLLSFSDSSYSTKFNPQIIKEQFNEKERGQITDENIDSFLSASNLVKFCPKCTSGNSSTGNWCMECGCVLIGITPQLVAVSSNVDKVSFLNPSGRPKQKKAVMLPINIIAAAKEDSDRVESDIVYPLTHPKVNTGVSSGTCELQLSTYEKYLLYMEHLQKIRSQQQKKEIQPADVQLLNDNASQTEVVDESKNYCGKQEVEENDIASFKASTCFSDYSNKKQIDGMQDSDDSTMCKPDQGTISSEEICIMPEVSALQCAPQEKDFQQNKNDEIAKDIVQRVFWKQMFRNQENQSLTFTECDNKKITVKDADTRPRRRKSVQSSLNQHQRCWEKSSIAWSSYTYGTIKSRSTNTNRPRSADDCRKSRKQTLVHDGPSALLATKNKGPRRHLTKRPVSADVLSGKRAPQETPTSKALLQNAAMASVATVKSCEISESLNNHAFPPCDKLICKGIGDHLWLYLPDEIWIRIFTLLSHQDVCQAAQVCHCFRRLANDETLWKTIQIENRNCLTDDCLANIGHHQPQSLRLYRCNDRTKCITDSGLKKLFSYCKDSLKELSVTSCSGPKLSGDTILLCASAVCHKLTSVDVSWTAATSKGIIALAQASSSLYRLLANGCQLTDESINILIKKHKTSLRELEVFGCHELSAQCLIYMAQECPNLQILNAGRIPNITTTCLIRIVTSLKNLTVLNLSGLNAVHDRVVHHIVRQCPKMDRLTLSSCPQLTDVSLFEVGTYLPTIRHLDVSGCKKVTDTGVQALAMSCHKLQYLDLSSTATSKMGICLLASYCNQNLECVKLSFCKEMTGDTIKKLCKNCKRLKLVHMYGCHSIHDLKTIQDVNKQVKLHHDLPLSAVTNRGR